MPTYFRRRPKYRYLYRSFYRKPLPLFQRLLIFIVLLAIFVFAAVSLVLTRLRPLMFKYAKTIVTDVVLIEVNDVVEAEILKGSFDYTKLVTLERDYDGSITALVTNTAMINTLQTKISSGVYKTVDDILLTELEIPVGNAVGGILFSGRGPKFKVIVLSIADVSTKFTNGFEAAGINQTRHKIYMDIVVDVDIMIPGYEAQTIAVSDQVVVAETVIVGKVPDVYASFPEINTGE